MTEEIYYCSICTEVIPWVQGVGTHGERARAYHWKDGKRIHAYCDPKTWALVQDLKELHTKVSSSIVKE